MATKKTLQLPSGKPIPLLGQGTWEMGEEASKRSAEIAALRKGLDLGLSLIDTAEMYAKGGSEELVAEAIGERRKEVFLVSKVLPQHATRAGTIAACEGSLRRLKTDYLDLYLLHWQGSVSFSETLEGFQLLKQAGKILDYGVSNFDLKDMEEARPLVGGKELATNQVLYNLVRRGIEWDLLPWCRAHQIPIMAYSPIEQGKLLQHPVLQKIARRHAVTSAQVALAWVLQQPGVVTIPKAGHVKHVLENYAALEIKFSLEDLQEIDQAFPVPTKKKPLEML